MANPDLTAEQLKRLRKPPPGSARLERFVRKQKAKSAVAKDIKDTETLTRYEDKVIRFHCYLRDSRKCRAFGVPLLFETDNPRKLAENHHIELKSAGGDDTPANRITLSPEAHRLRHDELLDMEGDGNATVTFTQYEMRSGTRTFLRSWESTVNQ